MANKIIIKVRRVVLDNGKGAEMYRATNNVSNEVIIKSLSWEAKDEMLKYIKNNYSANQVTVDEDYSGAIFIK